MIAQRLRQFATAGRPPAPADFELARSLLDPPLLELWEGQHPRDIVHSAATARWLIERGHDDPDLLAAALLHDVAKGPQRRRDRVAYVTLGWVHAANLAGAPNSRFEMRRAIARSLSHSERGAAMILEAGGSHRTAELTLHHHESPAQDPVLALLQRADAAS